MPKPPKARSNSSPSPLGTATGVPCNPDASALDTSTSIRFPWAGSWLPVPVFFLSGSNILASLSSQPGATLLFSASSLAAIESSHALSSLSASSCTFWIYACRALQDWIISSGCAAWPDEDTTYGVFSSPPADAAIPVDDGGRVEGRVL